MQPLYMEEIQKERHEELLAAADSWRLAHPSGRHTLRYRAGARLIRFGHRLMGGGQAY